MKFNNKLLLIFIPLLTMLVKTTNSFAQQQENLTLEWERAAYLHDKEGHPSLGFAGPINGLHHQVLVVAGGANFPDKMPWEGGKKKYYDAVYVLEKKGEKYAWNTKVQSKLPEPIAYCGVTSTPLGIVYVGGENENGLSNKAYLLQWNKKTNEVGCTTLPNFPKAITNVGLTSDGHMIYAVGGDQTTTSSNQVFCLNLKSEQRQWIALENFPFALASAAVVMQNSQEGPCLFVIGGRTKTPSGISNWHPTVYAFHLKKKEWKAVAMLTDGQTPMHFAAGSVVAINKNELLLLGGDTGHVFHKIETYLSQIAQSHSETEKEKWIQEKNLLNTQHTGFNKNILCLNTLTYAWRKIGELPFMSPVTTTAVVWGYNIVLSNGEIKPGIRTPNIMIGRFKK